ncbi:NAD(P)H-dependent oxidoreductase [Cryptosporangium sp. NPDC048952]|uniref:NAD(P)H-dependent oxidoreductase n=1 Tax=Cryptosporangium sp. NPDC048952 TaxID=3363961 RepID=UPI00371CC72A
MPLYNYGVPTSFKAWIDQIVVVGRRIALPDGPPAKGRHAIVMCGYRGLELDFVLPSSGLAPVVPQMAEFRSLHEGSLAEAHEQARKLGESFRLAA